MSVRADAGRAVPQQQEELHVARRSRQRAGRDGHGTPAAAGGRVGDGGHRLGPQREVADHATLADPVLAHLELGLDHQRQLAVAAT